MIKSVHTVVEKSLLDLPSYMRSNTSISNSNDSFKLSVYLLNKFLIESEQSKNKSVSKTLDQITTLIVELIKNYNINSTNAELLSNTKEIIKKSI